MSLQLTSADLENPDILGRKLITLAEIIIRKHFYASVNEKDDLVSVGLVKAFSMLNDNKFNKDRGNICTYLYTGMRNDMHNYLYHQNKFNLTDISSMIDTGVDDGYFEEEYFSIPYSVVHIVCMKFIKVFGEGIEADVLQRLKEVGFTITGKAESNPNIKVRYVCRNDVLLDCFGQEVKDDVVNRIVGLVIWKKKEHDS